MVYKCLDPGRDWDAYCADNPEPLYPNQVDERFHIYVCCECSTAYSVDDFSNVDAAVHLSKDGRVYCTDCCVDGAAPECELEVDMDAFNKWSKSV